MNYSTKDISKKGTSGQHNQSYRLIGIISIFSIICITTIAIDKLRDHFYISIISGVIGLILVLYWQKKYIDLRENALVHLWLVLNGTILLTFAVIPFALALIISINIMLIMLLLKIVVMNIVRPTNGKLSLILLRLLNIILFAGASYVIVNAIIITASNYTEYVSKYISNGNFKFLLPLIVVAIIAALIWIGFFSKKINLDKEPPRKISVYPVTDFKPSHPDRNVFIRLAIGDLALRSAYWEFYVFLPLLATILILTVTMAMFPSIISTGILPFGLGVLFVFRLMGLYGVVKCLNNVSKKIWRPITIFVVIFDFLILLSITVK